MDKKDLEEIENWKKQRMNHVETYGVDIFRENKEEKSKVSKMLDKIFNLLYRIAKILLIILIFVIIIGTFVLLIWYYSTIYNKMHVDPVSTLSGMYGKNVEIVSSNIDRNKNGKYILTTKENPEIQFTAIVNWESMREDYSDRCQKYYYERWTNPNKYKLITEERYDENGDILVFIQYIEIKEKDEIEEKINLIDSFVNFAGDMFEPDWELYWVINGKRIYPFDIRNLSKEQAINKMEEML